MCWVFAPQRPNLLVAGPLWPRPGALRPPCRIVEAPRHPIRERGMRPVERRGNEAVTDRIEMDVLHVRDEVALAPHQVLPVAALPHRLLAARAAARIARR